MVERGKTRLWYPDFTLPEYGVIIEYAGFNGGQYEAGLRYKKLVYDAMSIPAIFVYRDSFRGYWPARLLGEFEKQRPEKLARILEKFRKRSAL